MLIMLCLWKRFRQRVCNIQICMYFANLYVTFFDILPYNMITLKYVLGSRVRPWFLRIRNGSCVVALDAHRVLHAWKHTQFDDELP